MCKKANEMLLRKKIDFGLSQLHAILWHSG